MHLLILHESTLRIGKQAIKDDGFVKFRTDLHAGTQLVDGYAEAK